MTILHLSDFHYSKRKHREQAIIVDALIKDLERICIGHRKPDLVMFTGDLVQAAGSDLHDDAYDFLIDPVSKATGCSDERIFIAPGNHDLSWTGLEQHADDTRVWRSLLGKSDEVSAINTRYETGAFDAAVASKFTHYLELEKFLNGDPRHHRRKINNSFVTVDHVSAINTDIVTFNTAVLSTGGHKSFENDERNLVIPEYAVIEACKALSDGSFRIFVTHHPTSWLSEQSAKYVEAAITKYADIHLFGHMHDPQPKKVIGLNGEVLANQAGAIFTSRREYYNGYSLLTIDRATSEVECLVRSYFKDRGEFDEGVDIVESGKWWSSQKARQLFYKIATPVDEQEFRDHLSSEALQDLTARENVAGGSGDVHGRFVAPPLRRTFINDQKDDEIKVEGETQVIFNDMIEADGNLIIYARSEFGRTTLLRELRYRFLSEAPTIKFPRLPAMIDFRDVSANSDNLLRKVRGSCEKLPQGHDIEALLKLGHVVILIDDVKFSDSNRMRILRDFVGRFPKARYIFSSPQSSATKLGACIDPEMPLRFEFVEIRELRRNDMRQLLAKEERCTNVEEWLDRLQDEFREINLPFTAANGSILIEILSEKYNFRPINRAVLIEQFIDSTLRKASVEQSRRETFDYTNKTDLLSHVAAWMARTADYLPTREEVRTEMKAYIDSRGLNANIHELMNEFLSAKILIENTESRVGFRYRGVLEYFIALRMSNDGEFKDWVLEDERYLSFINEIGYYAGKVRNDTKLVELIGSRHLSILNDAAGHLGKINLAEFDTLALPGEKKPDEIAQLESALATAPLSGTEKDQELETDDFEQADDAADITRWKFEKVADRIAASLILYSSMIKNMELISDADKRRHLKPVWQGWAIMLMISLGYAPKLAKTRRIRIGNALYEVQAPQGMNDSVLLRKMLLLLPHLHIKVISGCLGTEKLERQLTEPMLDESSEDKVIKLLKVGVISELRLAPTPKAISHLATELSDNMYLLWSLVVHVSELRRVGRIKDEDFKKLEVPLANAIADLRGGNPKTRANIKRQQIAKLAKDRLMLKLKRDQERRS